LQENLPFGTLGIYSSQASHTDGTAISLVEYLVRNACLKVTKIGSFLTDFLQQRKEAASFKTNCNRSTWDRATVTVHFIFIWNWHI